MTKSKQNSSKKKEQTKSNTHIKPWNESYMNWTTGGRMHMNEERIETLAFEFVAWAKQQESEKKPKTTLNDFYAYKDLNKKTFILWANKYPILAEARDQAKMILGSLRENGVNRREFAPNLIEKNIHNYDPEWDEVNQYWSKLKAKSGSDDGLIEYLAKQLVKKGIETDRLCDQEDDV